MDLYTFSTVSPEYGFTMPAVSSDAVNSFLIKNFSVFIPGEF